MELIEPVEMPEDEGLSANQQLAIVALINQPSVAKAAESAGVGERTMHSWLRQPEFQTAYRRARRDVFAQAIGLTQRYAPMAIQTLAKIMADTKASNQSRVSAAVALLRFSRESIELDDLAERIESLERAATTASE